MSKVNSQTWRTHSRDSEVLRIKLLELYAMIHELPQSISISIYLSIYIFLQLNVQIQLVDDLGGINRWRVLEFDSDRENWRERGELLLCDDPLSFSNRRMDLGRRRPTLWESIKTTTPNMINILQYNHLYKYMQAHKYKHVPRKTHIHVHSPHMVIYIHVCACIYISFGFNDRSDIQKTDLLEYTATHISQRAFYHVILVWIWCTCM